jgi:hypothetical protein
MENDMSEWQPIETAPEDNVAVIFFYAKRERRNSNGDIISFGPIRDVAEATEIGFFQNGCWCESGTGHSVFEGWQDQSDTPTHWMPLPAPPTE